MTVDLLERSISLGEYPSHDNVHKAKLCIENVSFWYGKKQVLKDVSIDIFDKEVTAFLGPSGCGKTTLLQTINRTNELVDGARMTGRVLLDDSDVYAADIDPPIMRRRFGWIAQRPNLFPRSIRSNLLYGPQIHGLSLGASQNKRVEQVLQQVGLWDEVKDGLDGFAPDLSIGQQQRLCIARALANEPDVILMDEPCSALDPLATAVIEHLIDELRRTHAVIVITHNLQQAARIAQRVAFFHLGEVLEQGDARQIFLDPRTDRCRNFVMGRYG